MTTKAELVDQARAAGIDVDPSATKAELEEVIANLDPAVVRSPEHEPQHGGHPVGDVPPEATTGDQEVADHHHEAGLGPELTPAGAHRHPGGAEHNHPVPVAPDAAPEVIPPPAEDEDGKSPAVKKAFVVEADCQAVVNGSCST
jgi:hypothetical protein